MKKTSLLFILLVCLSVNINAQTYNSIFSNDKYKVTEFSDNIPETILIDNNDDTIWVSYLEDLNYANCKIMSLDKDLNIISNVTINYPASIANMVRHKINDKFYGVYYTNLNKDTLQFRCFDRNGDIVVDKSLWIKNNEDTLWINRGFIYRKLSNNNFLFVASACYPSNTAQYGSDAVKFILFDTMANIINTKTYTLKTQANAMNMCEVGNNIIIEKWIYNNPYPIGIFSTFGISIINKETLDVEDSILRPHFYTTDSDGDTIDGWCPDHYRLCGINDSIFAGLVLFEDEPNLHIINKNTKDIIHETQYFIEGSDTSTSWSRSQDSTYAYPGDDVNNDYGKYSFTNPDSIYTYYFARRDGNYTYLELLNFSISGNVNFTYRFTFRGVYSQLRGIKATKDGGAVLSVIGGSTNTQQRASWLIKFNPNGLVGLTNIETQEKESIKVYPNPARDYVNVDIESTNFKASDIELLDMQGRIVKKAKLKAKQGNRIDVSALNAGAYTYNVSLNGKTISGKIIIGK